MCLQTHFMAKTVLRKEFTRSEIMVFGLFEGQCINIFLFCWSHWNPGTKIYKISKLQLGMCLQTLFMAKTVLRKEIMRSEIMVFGLFGGRCTNIFHFFWSHSNPGTKIYKNSPTTARNVPPNPFYDQNRTAK